MVYLRTLWRKFDPAWQASLTAYIGARALIQFLAILVVAVYPGTLDVQAEFRERIGFPRIEGPVQNGLWGVWLRGDTLWYMWYARDGLLPVDHPDYRAFFPLYPWLMRLVAPLFASNYLIAGLVVSNVALVLALVVFYRLVEWECDAHVARRGMWYMLLFPSAVFLFAAYTESLFLLFGLAAFYAARRERWGWAGLWVALAATLRVSGVFLALALGAEYLRQRMALAGWAALRDGKWWQGALLHAWPFLIMAAGLAFVPVYTMLVLHADSLVAVFSFHLGDAVGKGAAVFPWQALAEAVGDLMTGRFFVIQPFDLAAAVLFLGLTVAAFVCLPFAYGVYMALTMWTLVSRSIPQHPLIGTLRYVLGLFPAFMVLGRAGQKPWANRLILYPFLLGFGFFVAQFMIGGFIG